VRDSYRGIVYELQALRRRVDGVSSATASALGVRAQVYPHQVENIDTILSATEIRHLLADEVGLGKTVQALMVINAVRKQHPKEHIAILVPDALTGQWTEELILRGHEAPGIRNEGTAGFERSVHLYCPSWLDGPSDLDPADFSLLVVDEIHNLTADLREYLVKNARNYSGILLLSATPGLDIPSRQLEILAILEPLQVEAAKRRFETKLGHQLEGNLRKWPADAQSAILADLEMKEIEAARGVGNLLADDSCLLAHRKCLHRRILRSSREKLGDLLPRRGEIRIEVEPNEAERVRAKAFGAYCSNPQRPENIDLEAFSLRASLGGPSLRTRIGELIRFGADVDNQLAVIQENTGEQVGDSRLDALCDLLNKQWIANPQEKVVVVCIDNPTVDYVSQKVASRLKEIGPREAMEDLVVSTARKGEGSTEGLYGEGSIAQDAIEEFQSGAAQVLFVGDIANVGLNLQSARVLVFYCVPWSPADVEQWIGRLDRLGNKAALKSDGTFHPIEIFTICHTGLLDFKIVEIHSASGVFKQPINPTGDVARLASERILSSILHEEGSNDSTFKECPIDEDRSPLANFFECPQKKAKQRASQEANTPLLEPALLLGEAYSRLPRSKREEMAVEAWHKAFDLGQEYRSSYRRGVDAALFWYSFADSPGKPRLNTDVILAHLRDPSRNRSTENSVAYISRRQQIQQPPRKAASVTFPWKKESPTNLQLQYMNHGGLLHDDLVDKWCDYPGREAVRVQIRPPAGHSILSAVNRGDFLTTVGWIDSGAHILPGPRSSGLVESGESQPLDLRHHNWAHAADQRWIRNLLPAKTFCYAKGKEGFLVNDAGWCFFKPVLSPGGAGAPGIPEQLGFGSLPLGTPGVSSHILQAKSWFESEVKGYWGGRLNSLERAVDDRVRLVLDKHEEEVADLVAQYDDLKDREASADERTARIYRARSAAMEERVKQLTCQTKERVKWLRDIMERAESPQVEVFNTYYFTIK
jgi:ATP-dependent helicase HepA